MTGVLIGLVSILVAIIGVGCAVLLITMLTEVDRDE